MILRHKPSLQCKAKNLGYSSLNGESQDDPLKGNYHLIKPKSIVLGFAGENNILKIAPLKAIGTLDNLNKPKGKKQDNGDETYIQLSNEEAYDIKNPYHTDTIGTVAGDFYGNGKEVLAIIYKAENHFNIECLDITTNKTKDHSIKSLIKYQTDLPSSIEYCMWLGTIIEDPNMTHKSNISIETGNDGVKKELLVIGYLDDNDMICLKMYDFKINSTEPFNTTFHTGCKLSSYRKFDIAIGVFTGESNNELAISYHSKENKLILEIFRLTENGLQSIIKSDVSDSDTVEKVIVKSGAIAPGEVKDGIVLTWTTKAMAEAKVQIWKCGSEATVNTLVKKDSIDKIPIFNNFIRIAIGDLNDDGVEELVIAFTNNDDVYGHLVLRTYRFNNAMEVEADNETKIKEKSEAHFSSEENFTLVAFDLSIEIADLKDVGPAIIFAALGADNSLMSQNGIVRVTSGAIPVNPKLQFPSNFITVHKLPGIFSKTYAAEENKDLSKLKISLSTGDFNGDSIYVAAPRMYRLDAVRSVLAIINTPPLPIEFSSCSRNINLHNSRTESSSLEVTSHNSYTTSDSIGGNISVGSELNGSISASIDKTYGNDFSKSHDKDNTVSVSLSINESNDDSIIFYEKQFLAWEYPVIYQDKKQGHILVIFPNTKVDNVTVISGTNLPSYYKPRHSINNILSYPSTEQDLLDFASKTGSKNFCGSSIYVDSSQVSFAASFSTDSNDFESNSTSESSSINSSESASGFFDFLGGIALGIHHSFDDSYTKSKSSNYSYNISKDTYISGTIIPNELDITKSYEITPYIYWSTIGNFLKLDYIVSINNGSTWFQKKFKYANPSFHVYTAKDYSQYTRDIEIYRPDNKTDYLDIYVTVHNDSLSAANNVQVILYDTNPSDTNAKKLDSSNIVSTIQSRDISSFHFPKVKYENLDEKIGKNTSLSQYIKIFAAITFDEQNDISEKSTTDDDSQGVIKNDKIGYGVFPISAIS